MPANRSTRAASAVKGVNMKCSNCGSLDSKVIDSRITEDGTSIRRRRECSGCGKRFTTYETMEVTPTYVVKRSGARQAYDPSKLRSGVLKACEKRPVSISEIDKLVEEINKTVDSNLEREVSSKYIGELVMEGLKKIDEVAYVRFASVHRQFKDISTWVSELENILKNKKQ